ncbi:MAG: hypothetical protein ACRD3J_03870 [Thermoanaerobaculia bacterium]
MAFNAVFSCSYSSTNDTPEHFDGSFVSIEGGGHAAIPLALEAHAEQNGPAPMTNFN